MDSSSSRGESRSAESLFAAWLAEGAKDDLEALLRAHPEHTQELRDLHSDWQRLQPVLVLSGLGVGSVAFADRLRAIHGDDVDPEISLAGGGLEPPPGATSDLVRRLAEPGPKASRYRIGGELARGGMGVILRVWDADLRRHLAMKLAIGRADEAAGGAPRVDARALARFLEEAQVTAQLDHPGIVPVHELGLDSEGRVYFTMKLVKGRDLKTIFGLVFEGKEGWDETRALRVLLKACQAVAYAHAKGVVHRDLKPANVMVGGFGEVYVMDWGLARVLGRRDAHDVRLQDVDGTAFTGVETERLSEREDTPDSPLVTLDGEVVGTPAYMSLEQARGETERISARSDVYAVGAMLYHLLGRQMPYVPAGAKLSNRTLLLALVQGPPQPLADIARGAPAELVAICEKAMARDPEGRYPDTLALAEDLEAFLEGKVVRAYASGPIAQLRKWVVRNKAAAGLIAVLAAAVMYGPIAWKAYRDIADERTRSRDSAVLAMATGSDRGPDEEIRGIASRLCERILAGESSPQDRYLMASREFAAGISVPPIHGGPRFRVSIALEQGPFGYLRPSDLGVVATPRLYLDGEPVEDRGAFEPNFLTTAGSYTVVLFLASPSPGRHVFTGGWNVQFVRSKVGRNLATKPVTEGGAQDLFDEPFGEPCFLPAAEAPVVILSEMPSGFPLAIREGSTVDAFRDGIVIDSRWEPATAPSTGLLWVAVQFPRPSIPFPMKVWLSGDTSLGDLRVQIACWNGYGTARKLLDDHPLILEGRQSHELPISVMATPMFFEAPGYRVPYQQADTFELLLAIRLPGAATGLDPATGLVDRLVIHLAPDEAGIEERPEAVVYGEVRLDHRLQGGR